MRVDAFVDELMRAGVRLWEESGSVRYRAPRGIMTEGRVTALRARRDEVLDYLRNGAVQARAHPQQRHEPFPLTDVQAAYTLGRRDIFRYGNVGCHGYGELEFARVDPQRLAAAWRGVVARHDMLRAVVDADGAQRVLPDVPEYEVVVSDLRSVGDAEAAAGLAAVRADLDHRVYATDQWPLFDLRVTRLADRDLVHFSIDFLICDFVSIRLLIDELLDRYDRPDVTREPLEITFRDYLLAERELRQGGRFERDRTYWLDRLPDLPAAPVLPTTTHDHSAPARFRRWAATIEPTRWAAFQDSARRCGLTASAAVLAAYAEVVAAWSGQPRFTLNVTTLNRMPLHPQVDRLVGDFTSVSLLSVETDPAAPLRERAATLQEQLWQDLDHRLFSGVEVVREISRRAGADAALFPIVFTSAIGLTPGAGAAPVAGPSTATLGYGISQTPQVLIDCQNIERDGALATNWDVREGVFPDGMVDAMFAAFVRLLGDLADSEAGWAGTEAVRLPDDQRQRRATVNDTAAPLPDGLLHDRIVRAALRDPDRVAVSGPTGSLTYGELLGRSRAVAGWLVGAGCQPGDRVAVVMDKGPEQVISVLGVLLAGAAYVPVDTNQPTVRRERILTDAAARAVLTQSWLDTGAGRGPLPSLSVDQVSPATEAGPVAADVGPDDLAYVIYTSGSTGAPKGVMISHRGALNTVLDINERFHVGPDDRVLGLASLGFDLSVYDIVGPLSVGGCLVLPAAHGRGDPSHWARVIAEYGVTVWNSVPAQLQMLTDYLATGGRVALPGVRLALLSGDWIPVTLPAAVRALIPGIEVVSLGGATEASIWSIWHPIADVPADAVSIPYGVPLANQRFHVLDDQLRARPDWVPGELYIAGTGLALGYLGDEARTAERFITHPVTGERLYRTGDLGRYLPDGTIEFLGRDDLQVKIRGHRIELGEVDSALAAYPGVAASAVVVDGDDPLQRRLVAFAQPAPTTPAPAADLTAAAAAGAELLDGLDLGSYLAYLRGLDEVALLAMVRTLCAGGLFADGATHDLSEILRGARVAPAHHRLVRRWLRALTDNGLLVRDADTYRLVRPVDDEDLDRAWDAISRLREAAGDDTELVEYFRLSTEHLPALLRADTDPLRLLFPDGRLDVSEDLYADALFNRWANRVAAAAVGELAAAADAPLRVLEVGAGTGGTTGAMLAELGPDGVDYLFTDLSAYFVGGAQERFGHEPGVRFARYDLDEDYRAQGLAPNSFDVIVAGDVLHTTRDVGRTLARLRELLAPGGWLVAIEMTRDHYQIMTSLELLVRLDEVAGDFTDDRRGTDQTFLTRQDWFDQLDRVAADTVRCLPGIDDEFLGELGMTVLLARFKSDRVRLDSTTVLRHVSERLPSFMVPARLEIVDQLPLTPNGKVDRAALRSWARCADAPTGPTPAGEAPAEGLEQAIAAVWAAVLGVASVGREQSFFDLGGDSLLAAKLAGRLIESVPQAAGVFFDQMLREILDRPTVADLAAHLAAQESAAGGHDWLFDAPAQPALVPLSGNDGPAVVFVPWSQPATYAEVAAACGAGVRALAVSVPAPDGPPTVAELVDGCVDALGGVSGPVTLVGHGLDGLLALEVARRLLESGRDVERLVVSGTAPVPYPVTDPAQLEDLCRRELGADADDELDPAVATYGRLLTELAGHPPTAYVGDVTLVLPRDPVWPGFSADPVAAWERICLGELTVVRSAVDLADALRGAGADEIAAAVR
ncbi:non-ribosomal peptide synthetase [Luedemannella helvata]|uniref:Phenyloxazoline synthase MbtB n=2 Tax=Luedemannella helvata TaxID=349315 RepID=A0ABN2KUU9_9ACTN